MSEVWEEFETVKKQIRKLTARVLVVEDKRIVADSDAIRRVEESLLAVIAKQDERIAELEHALHWRESYEMEQQEAAVAAR